MSDTIQISVENAKANLDISGYPNGVAFEVGVVNSEYVVPAHPNKTISVDDKLLDYDFTVAIPQTSLGLTGSSCLDITLGTLPENELYKDLNKFKYRFENFVDSGTSSLEAGDVVTLVENIDYNAWNCECKKVDTDDVYTGAFNTIYIFISHEDNDLILMSRGYFDLPDSKISQWTSGRTLYINQNNILDITPTGASGAWVRAMGMCIPNTENKKRIWFQPDSTFIQIN